MARGRKQSIEGVCSPNKNSHPIPSKQVFTKLFWFSWRILLPLCHPAFHTSWAVFWPLFFVSEFMTGYFLAFNFQVCTCLSVCLVILPSVCLPVCV